MNKLKTMLWMFGIAILEIIVIMSIDVYQNRNSKNGVGLFNKNKVSIEEKKEQEERNLKENLGITGDSGNDIDDSDMDSRDNYDGDDSKKSDEVISDSKDNTNQNIEDEEIPLESMPQDMSSINRALKNAIVIGDSRVISLYNRLNLDNASFAFDAALSSKALKNKRLYCNQDIEGNAYSIIENNKYKKVYLSVGINDIKQTDVDSYYHNIKEYVQYIKNNQRNAKIYFCSIIYVSEKKAGKNNKLNVTIDKFNKQLKQLAKEYDCKYLDMSANVKTNNSSIKEKYTIDGINLNTDGCLRVGQMFI